MSTDIKSAVNECILLWYIDCANGNTLQFRPVQRRRWWYLSTTRLLRWTLSVPYSLSTYFV